MFTVLLVRLFPMLSSEVGVIRYQWNIRPGARAVVIIERPTGPSSLVRRQYCCSGKSVLRLIALARRHPRRFQGYM